MKLNLLLALCCLATTATMAQSKVFREVNNEMSSTMKTISQDDALIGYLVFTQLEKANKDSFNYRVSIMDENLNDIGKLEFREKHLELHAVSFEQDILCLAYLKSDLSDLQSASTKEIKQSVFDSRNYVFTQLVNLEGKIIHSSARKVELELNGYIYDKKKYRPSAAMAGHLKYPIIMKNIPSKGFALFYGDANRNMLSVFDAAGKQLWEKPVTGEAQYFTLLPTAKDVYLLTKRSSSYTEGGFDLRGFHATDGTAYDKYALKDKQGNELKVLDLDLDPATGHPLVTGLIINKSRGNGYSSVRGLHKGVYDGVFSIVVNGPKKTQIREKFSYWKDGSKEPDITTTGKLSGSNAYPRLASAIRDYNGNTYFIGSSYERRTRTGAIVTSVALSWTLVTPMLLMSGGTHKAKQTDVVILRQDSTGKLRYENSIDAASSGFIWSKVDFAYYPGRNFYNVKNAASKSNFLIVDDSKQSVIYNIEKKKIIRTVPHRDGNVVTYIYPAKEGHIMVMEYDRRVRETKLSIESL